MQTPVDIENFSMDNIVAYTTCMQTYFFVQGETCTQIYDFLSPVDGDSERNWGTNNDLEICRNLIYDILKKLYSIIIKEKASLKYRRTSLLDSLFQMQSVPPFDILPLKPEKIEFAKRPSFDASSSAWRNDTMQVSIRKWR